MKMTEWRVGEDERRKLRDDGCFVTPALFDAATLDAVQAEFDRLWREDIAAAEAKGNPTSIEFVRLRPFFSQLGRRSAVCAAFCRHPALVAVAQAILGDDLDMSWDQAIVKPPAKGKAFAWHQDGHYAVNGPHTAGADIKRVLSGSTQITFWIAITRTTIANGTLWVVPGMHKQGLLPHVWSDAQREWQCQFDSSGKVAMELSRGQALVFTNLVPHASGPNVSDEVRMAYQIGFIQPGILKNDYQVPVLRGGTRV